MANWYYYDASGNRIGPLPPDALKLLAANGSIKPETILENDKGQKAPASKVKGMVFPQPLPTPQEETWYVYPPGEERQGPFSTVELHEFFITLAGKMANELSLRDVVVTQTSTGKTDKAYTFPALFPDGLTTDESARQREKEASRTCLGCFVALLILVVLIVVTSRLACTKGYDHAPRSTPAPPAIQDNTPTPLSSQKEWYEGGTLHKATVAEWGHAGRSDKLATAADWISACLQKEGKLPKDMEVMELMAMRMVSELDRATEGLPDAAQGQPVADMAVLIWLSVKDEYKDVVK